MGVAVLHLALEKVVTELGAYRDQSIYFRRAKLVDALDLVIRQGIMGLNKSSLLKPLYIAHGYPFDVVVLNESITGTSNTRIVPREWMHLFAIQNGR
jgi:hypothetical protein